MDSTQSEPKSDAHTDANSDASGKGRKGRKAGWFSRICTWLDENDAIWPLVAFTLLIVAGLIVLWADPACPKMEPVMKPSSPESGTGYSSQATTFLLLLWVAWLYAWVTHCFAGDAYNNRTRTIKFAYFFVILSFVAVSIMVASISRARSFGVVEGCIASTDDSSFLPVRCDQPLRLPQPQTFPETKEAALKGQAPAAAGPGTIVTGSAQLPTFRDRMNNAAVNHNYHHLLNIGGRLIPITLDSTVKVDVFPQDCPATMIQGGVPVPVYFILLALIGAAISLARNVPVIQRRSEDEYVSTASEPRLLPGQVRELLAFQILQFVSAPFLAVAAYHTLKPESLATTVALGFLTGFASERILALLSVRFKDTSERTEVRPVLAGSIQGEVKLAGKPVAGVTVEIEGQATVKEVKTDASGRFKFMAVPVGSAPYRLVAKFTDKDGNFSGSTSVQVDKPTEANAGTIQLDKIP